MRTAFIGLCLFIGFGASSQQIDMEQLKKNHPNLKWEQGTKLPSIQYRVDNQNELVQALSSHALSKGTTPGVYALPLDNMPCVVPDTKDIAAIPNPGLGYRHPVVGRIPNKVRIYSANGTASPNTR